MSTQLKTRLKPQYENCKKKPKSTQLMRSNTLLTSILLKIVAGEGAITIVGIFSACSFRRHRAYARMMKLTVTRGLPLTNYALGTI